MRNLSRPQYNARQTVTSKLCLFILSLALGWPHYQHILVSLSHQHICLLSLPPTPRYMSPLKYKAY